MTDWYNNRRLHGEIGHIPPAEHEAAFFQTSQTPQLTAKALNRGPTPGRYHDGLPWRSFGAVASEPSELPVQVNTSKAIVPAAEARGMGKSNSSVRPIGTEKSYAVEVDQVGPVRRTQTSVSQAMSLRYLRSTSRDGRHEMKTRPEIESLNSVFNSPCRFASTGPWG